MTTFLYSQAIPDSSNDVSVNSNTQKIQEAATVVPPPDYKPISQEEFKLAAEVLQLAELQHNISTAKFIRQTASAQYKKVSEKVNPEAIKPKFRKKSLKAMMQESFFHGAYWLGSNFIA